VDGEPGLKPPRQEWSWRLLVAAAVGSVLAAGFAGVLSAPPWLQALCIIVGVVLTLTVVELQRRRAQTERHARELRTHVAGAGEQMLTVSVVGLQEAGVHRARREVPYVQRDAEIRAMRTLQERGRVLIVGSGLAGKSRLALQVAQQLFAQHAFVRPNDGQALRHLLAEGYTLQRVLVWLDGLEPFLTGGLTVEHLDALSRDGAVVVATIGSGAYGRHEPVGDLKTSSWDVLEGFDPPVWLPETWTQDELQRVKAVVSPQVFEAASRYGLSAYLGAGPQATGRFLAGESRCPEGHALVRAVADWRRVGRSTAIPREVLVRVLPAYLPPRIKDADVAVRIGLKWAKEPLTGTNVGLLEEVDGGYEVLDYMVEFLTEQDLGIPEAMWDAAGQGAATEETLVVGLQAVRQELEDRAEAAWQGLDHPLALYNLGVLHERRGDLRGAEHWWQAAAQAGDPGAMYRLGRLLLKQDARRAPEGEYWLRLSAKAAGRPAADKLADADAQVPSAEARIAFSGAATEIQQRLLTAALRRYMAYLEQLDIPLGPVPTVHIAPGTDIAYPMERSGGCSSVP
jgi:hypothetical protein